MNILEHLSQKTIFPLHLLGVDLTITNGVITLWTSALLVFLFFFVASRSLKIVPGRLQNIAEIIILFLKEEIAEQIHDKEKWLPFIVAIFSFILVNNLLALIPGVQTATGNINVTAALAIIVFLAVQGTGIRKWGFWRYLKTLIPEGVPLPIIPLIFVIELVSQLARPFSLAIRLFANMFAGHSVMLILISLIFIFKSYFILPLPVIGNAVVLAFELFIAFIQAFIFAYLTGVYIAIATEGH